MAGLLASRAPGGFGGAEPPEDTQAGSGGPEAPPRKVEEDVYSKNVHPDFTKCPPTCSNMVRKSIFNKLPPPLDLVVLIAKVPPDGANNC